MITLYKYILFSFILCLLFSQLRGQSDPTKGFLKIKNDTFWDTQDGGPLYSQGGGIFSFKDPEDGQTKYFWYGAKYQESEKYRNDPSVTPERDNFVSVTCYVSTDLVNWTSHGDVLTLDELNKNSIQTRWAGRLGVSYIKEIDKYALLIQHNDQLLVTLSERPNGPFKWHQRIDMTGMIGTSNTGDQTVFTDEDTGKSYLVYSYGRGRNRIYISQIGVKEGKVGLLDCNMVFKGEGREGNCMFKHNGKYYLFASNLYGWDSSFAYYLVSDNIYGPYTPTNEMLIMEGSEADYAHVTQTGFFVTLKGTKKHTVIYCGDRWANFAGNGLGYNQWCPLSFDGPKPIFNSLSSWNLHPTTGEWLVSSDNNYAKNGSFEADRRHIPSPVKPVQEQLLGWQTTIIKGNKLSVSDSLSPVLNYFNTAEDRKQVIGEKSLQISDKIDFKRKVSQIIQSSQDVKLADGKYTLTAKFKRGSGFEDLYMYALSDGKEYKQKLSKADQNWSNITLENLSVKNGRVEIGFIASGKANAYCYIDDVTLIRSKQHAK